MIRTPGKKMLLTMLILSGVINCSESMDTHFAESTLFLLAFEMQFFVNYCDTAQFYSAGNHNITSPASRKHWFTFPIAAGIQPYVITIQEATGQNVTLSVKSSCKLQSHETLGSSDSTGQLEYFKFLNQAAYFFTCTGACEQPFLATIPSGPL
ncbi:MAG: hypothetical protein KDK39_00960 [Leptospiraceae bacterium]|nr:hypothetical protein [Leptospiraceae bacterium]